ncbi:MAG: Ig domain-containing protein, partial [Desulfuromonadales bacterium]
TPSATGLTNLQVTVTDSTYPTPQNQNQNLSIRVTSSVTITTGAVLTNAKKGTAITPVTLAAKGGTPAYSWSIVGGALPSGLALDPASGIISGTPTDKGDFVFTIRVTDSVGNATGPANAPPNPDKQFFIHISDTLAVTTGAVPNGAIGLPYFTALTASGGLRNYSWAVNTGTLPAGMALDAASGTITGTPTSKITSSVTFEVTDSDAPAQKATTAALIFEISDTLSIYDRTLSDGRRNNAYIANVRAQLGTAPYSWSLKSGTLPTGTTFSQNAGVVTISGTPTTGGTFTFELEVNDNGTNNRPDLRHADRRHNHHQRKHDLH